MKIFIVILNLLFGSLFMISSFHKLLTPYDFYAALNNFKFFTNSFNEYLTIIIPVSELIIGLGIIFGIKPRLFQSVGCMLLIVFTSIITVKLLEGSKVNCGCFGALDSSELSLYSIGRNFIFITIGFVTLILNEYKSNNEKLVAAGKNVTKMYAFKFILLYLFSGIIFQNLSLTNQTKELKNIAAHLAPPKNLLLRGAVINELELHDFDGNQVSIEIADKSYSLFFILQTKCEACTKSIPLWNNLFIDLPEMQTNIYYVSLDSSERTKTYGKINSIPEDRLFLSTSRFRDNFKINLTPQTILMKGKEVIEVKSGIPDNNSISKLKLTFTNNREKNE